MKQKTRMMTITPFLYLLPAFLIYAVIVLYPLGESFRLTFYRWNGLTEKIFVGLENYYYTLFSDPVFRIALVNNIKWTLVSQLLPVTLGLFLAILFCRKLKGLIIFRNAIFFPTTLSLVIVALMWNWMYSPNFGLINNFIRTITGGRYSFNWLANPSSAIYYVAIAGSWGYTGVCMIMFLAGLQAIPAELYEAAEIDGANGFQRFIYITIPQLRNTINVVVIFTLINSFKVFDLIYVMTMGGPGRSTNVLAMWAYTQTFPYNDIGRGSTVAWILTAIVLAISCLYYRVHTRPSKMS